MELIADGLDALTEDADCRVALGGGAELGVESVDPASLLSWKSWRKEAHRSDEVALSVETRLKSSVKMRV